MSTTNGLVVDSVALCWQAMAVERDRMLGRARGRLSNAHLDHIAKNIAILVDFEPRPRR